MRKQIKRVHINSEVWQYQVGSSSVSIRDPQGKRVVVPRKEIVRGWPHNAEYGYDPDYDGPGITTVTFTHPTPAIVKSYICRKLRPGLLIKVPGDLEQAKASILNFFCGDKPELPEVVR